MPQAYHIALPEQLRGTVTLPASKSISARALIIAALAGNAQLENLSDCDDTTVLRRALAERSPEIDIHAAGTAMRFGTAFFAVTPGEHILTGTARMQQRPIRLLVSALKTLGADISYVGAEGFPPLRICGRQLEGGSVCIPADVSSQYISALLLVAPTMRRGLTLHLEGEVVSTPYINMTLNLMRYFGAKADWRDEHTLEVLPVAYNAGQAFHVEPDWSGASYWYELMALSPEKEACIHLPGLREDSVQGDSVVRKLFEPLGVKTTFTEEGITLTQMAPEGELMTDFTMCPDLAQTPFPLRRTAKPENQGDRPHRGAAKRTGEAGKKGGSQRPRDVVRRQRDSARSASRHRHLRRPPHGNGLRAVCLLFQESRDSKPGGRCQILSGFLGRPEGYRRTDYVYR